MSNLLNAPMHEEQDRDALIQARAQSGPSGRPRLARPAETSRPADIEGDMPRPAVMRSQRDAVKASDRVKPPVVISRPPQSFRGMGIALALATLVVVGVSIVLGNHGADDALTPVAGVAPATNESVVVTPTPIPAALPESDAGPLQLRLDRRVDAVGESEHRRNKLQ